MDLKLPDDFKEFLRLLNDHNVEYLLIGGYAVGFHGYARATNDLDIWVSTSGENVARLIDTLRAFGLDSPDILPEMFDDANILRLGVPPLRIEVMSEISGVDFDSCYVDRVVEKVDDVTIQIIDLASLKTNKRESARYKDLDDLENLD